MTPRSVKGENRADIVCSDRNVFGVVATMKTSLVRHAPLALALAVLLGSVADRTTGQPLPGVTVTFGAAQGPLPGSPRWPHVFASSSAR